MNQGVRSGALLRGIGYSPSEISSCVNRSVVQEHATMASVLWTLRQRALKAPHYKLKHLARLDERLSAHLAGLREAGPAGLRVAHDAMQDADPGAVFTLAYLAFHAGDRPLMTKVLQVSLADPAFGDPFVSALAWLPASRVLPMVARLGTSERPEFARVALSVYAARRLDAASLIAAVLDARESASRSRALRAIGETGCRRFADRVSLAVRDADPLCRLRAIEASALLQCTAAGEEALDLAGTCDERVAYAAQEIGIRCSSLERARDAIRSLVEAGRVRRAASAIGALGDPSGVRWLLDCMHEPQHARIAAESFCIITGADLGYLGLKQDALDLKEEEIHGDDADLPWPHPSRVADWWRQHEPRFPAGQRFLAGRAMSSEGLIAVLRTGYQRDRRRAAFELMRRESESMLFPVDERADRQLQRLAA